MKKWICLVLLIAAGCNSFVGNSPEERRHRKLLRQEEQTFNRQMWERSAPAVEETEAYFTFTNRLVQRDTEPMDLAALGKVTVEYYGSNVAWQVVTAAYKAYSVGAPLANATNVMWLVGQSPRTRDTAWMVKFHGEWMPAAP